MSSLSLSSFTDSFNHVYGPNRLPTIDRSPESKINSWLIGAFVISAIAIPVILLLSSKESCKVTDDLSDVQKLSDVDIAICNNFISSDAYNRVLADHPGLDRDALHAKFKQDCVEILALGVKNGEVADHLERILNQLPILKTNNFNSPQRSVSYDITNIKNTKIGSCSKIQNFDVLFYIHNDYKECMTKNKPNSKFGDIIKPYGCYKNTKNNVELCVKKQLINDIRNGFYFATSPMNVTAFLSGHSIASIQNAIGL